MRRILLLGLLLLSGCENAATPGDAATSRLELLHGPPSVALPGYPLFDSIKVRLSDESGFPLAGQPLQWSVVGGGGSASGQLQTDAAGEAAVEWTLGTVEGPQALRVTTLQDSTLELATEARYFRGERVAAGYAGGCALRTGDLWCWGSSGGLSSSMRKNVSRFVVGDFAPGRARPARITQGESFVDLRLNDFLICGLRADGTVGCLPAAWIGDSLPLVRPVIAPPLRSLTAGPTTSPLTCGLAISDSVPWCWDATRQATRVSGAPPLLDLAGVTGLNGALGGCGRQVDSTAWCWGGTTAGPALNGPPLRFTQLSVNAIRGCGLQPSQELWCWSWSTGSVAPVPVKLAESIQSMSTEHGLVLSLRGGRLLRWDQGNHAAWSDTPFANLASQLFTGLLPNLVYCSIEAGGAVYCAGEHFYTNNTGYYNDQYWPLQPVEP